MFMKRLTRAAGKDAKLVLVPGHREAVPRRLCVAPCCAMQRTHRRYIATQPPEATSDSSELKRFLAPPSERYSPAVHAQFRVQIGHGL
jgi:hypothetical protein